MAHGTWHPPWPALAPRGAFATGPSYAPVSAPALGKGSSVHRQAQQAASVLHAMIGVFVAPAPVVLVASMITSLTGLTDLDRTPTC